MSNYNGIRINKRTNAYVLNVGNKHYYYDKNSTLRGPYDTREDATTALRKAYDNEIKELENGHA